ncbi:MAG: S8 family serine peptidase, partial [Bacteroidota bacterium]
MTIAILDTAVNLEHPCFEDQDLSHIYLSDFILPEIPTYRNHGTYVCSQIFAKADSSAVGIAPHCKGIIIPVYEADEEGLFCTQNRLAEAIYLAVEHEADIINISGGELLPNDQSYLELKEAIRYCEEQDVLLIAAAGNDGCSCEHIPASLPNVLAVGASDDQDEPFAFTNFGEAYQKQGLLVSLKGREGALASGGYGVKKSTSYATPVMSAYVALLLCAQKQLHGTKSPTEIRDLILSSAITCDPLKREDCERFLVGNFSFEQSYEKLVDSPMKTSNDFKQHQSSVQAFLEENYSKKVKSLKIKAGTVNNHRSYYELDGFTIDDIPFPALTSAILKKVEIRKGEGYELFAIGMEEGTSFSNFRIYSGFRNLPCSIGDGMVIGYALGWSPGTDFVEEKQYERIPQQELNIENLSKGAIINESFNDLLNRISEVIRSTPAAKVVLVSDLSGNRKSLDIGGLPSHFLSDYLSEITSIFKVDDHPAIQNLKDGKMNHQNFAFGYDNEGFPFFTLYFKSQEDQGDQRADISPSNNHTITHIQNNTIINNQKLTSMNPNELMASETEFGPEFEASQETVSAVPMVVDQPEEGRVEPSHCSCQSKETS